MPIQRKDVAQITKYLESASLLDVPGSANQELSNRQAIRELAPALRKKKKEGFSTSALVAMLKSKNISIEGPTLNRYLKEWQVDKTDNKKARAKPSTAVSADTIQKKAAPIPAPKTQTAGDPDSDAGIAIKGDDRGMMEE